MKGAKKTEGCPGLAHRTVRCTRENHSELATFGFLGMPLRYNSPDCPMQHRTVRCAMLSNGYLRQRSSAKATGTMNSVRLRTQSQSRRQKAHRAVNRTYPVHHRTVRCARRQTASPTATLVVGAINTPQLPHFKASKFFSQHIQYKSQCIQYKTQLE